MSFLLLEDVVQVVVCSVVVEDGYHYPDGVEEHKHKPEVLEVQVTVKPRRPILSHVHHMHVTSTSHAH